MPRISVSLSEEEYGAFRVACAEVRLSMAATARGLVIEWLKEGEESVEQKTTRAADAAERVATRGAS
jgi:hypothetical protein